MLKRVHAGEGFCAHRSVLLYGHRAKLRRMPGAHVSAGVSRIGWIRSTATESDVRPFGKMGVRTPLRGPSWRMSLGRVSLGCTPEMEN
jgi:hypothetical protein